jgi:hypothetical protein
VGDQAISSLASLADRGLDPAALDAPDASLMTGRDPRPTADNTRVHLTFTGAGDGARAVLRDLVATDALKQEVLRCYLQWWNTSRQNSDQGTLHVAYSRGMDDYEELAAAHVTVTPVEVAPAENGDAGPNPHWLQCSQIVVQNSMTTLHWPARAEHFAESITVAVGPE